MNKANLYFISRPSADDIGYEEYDSCVVCAASPEEAVTIHPTTEKVLLASLHSRQFR